MKSSEFCQVLVNSCLTLIEIINAAFMPSEEELQEARRIVALFAENPGAGSIGMDGRMIDRPHLLQAQRLLDVTQPPESQGQ
jgi:citrate lyase beta subunit